MKKITSAYSSIQCEPEQLKKLFSLHDEYTEQVEYIVSRLIENFEEHDCFFNWLLFSGNGEYQDVVSGLEDQNIFIGNKRTSCLYDEDGKEVRVVA